MDSDQGSTFHPPGFMRLSDNHTANRKIVRGIGFLLAALLFITQLTSCAGLIPSSIATPLPTEFLPTAAALTLSASGAILLSSSQLSPEPTSLTIDHTSTSKITPPVYITFSAESGGLPAPTATVIATPQLMASPTPKQTATSSPSPPVATETSPPLDTSPTDLSSLLLYTPTHTPAPPIPDARIQILRLGELSKIASPLQVSTRLTCGEGKNIRFELYGEDGRLLARYLRTYNNIPWNTARIGFNMDFEISAAAELGRLVVSAEDSYGRLIEANSIDLILMAQGMSEINPPGGLQQRIIIQDPPEQSVIQTGKLIVSGRARPATNQPLRAMLVGEDGKILGQRLAGLVVQIPGDYGVFIAEVPYSIREVTPALLVIYEEGGNISPYTFLTSIHVLLAP